MIGSGSRSLRISALVFWDLAALVAAMTAASLIRRGDPDVFLRQPPSFVLSHLAMILCFYVLGLYDGRRHFWPRQTAFQILACSFVTAWVMAALFYFDRSSSLPRLLFLHSLAIFGILAWGGRMVYERILSAVHVDRKILLIGEPGRIRSVSDFLARTARSGFVVTGTLPVENAHSTDPALIADRVAELAARTGDRAAVICFGSQSDAVRKGVARALLRRSIEPELELDLTEAVTRSLPPELLDDADYLAIEHALRNKPYLRVKRTAEIGLVLLLSIAYAPLLLLAIPLLAAGGCPPKSIFFTQDRIGRGLKPFRIYKLRTLDASGNPTPVGRLLRRYRLDEAPQLWNVLKGEMSLIGPRPEMPHFFQGYLAENPFYRLSVTLPPGLTGWAQVNFGHTKELKDYRNKFGLDLYYLKHLGPRLDVLILLRSVRVVLFGRGK